MASDVAQLLDDTKKLREVVRSSRSVNINKTAVRVRARALVEDYFRAVRPIIAPHAETVVTSLIDAQMQRLLVLAMGLNSKSTYTAVLKEITTLLSNATFQIEKRLSDIAVERRQGYSLNDVETRVLQTLNTILPSAARSYMQAIQDLSADRVSYRGPAIELREALRETLDHMAPDDLVEKSAGYKREKDRSGPTMAQKARYILKQRKLSETTSKPTVHATEIVESLTANIVRSTYTSGSVSVHTSPTKAEVQQLKMYVDSALALLLGIFAN